MWDRSRDNELENCFWDAALAVDPNAKRSSGRQGSFGSAEALSELWRNAGLTEVEVAGVTVPCRVSYFDELWQPYLKSQAGPIRAFMEALSEDRREAFRNAMRRNVLGDGVDGPITLQAKAWAVKESYRDFDRRKEWRNSLWRRRLHPKSGDAKKALTGGALDKRHGRKRLEL
jgi:hypothetical protein